MLQRGQISPRFMDLALWHFRPMGPCSLSGKNITRSSCGTLQRGQISPRLRVIRVGSVPWHFRPMGPRWLPVKEIERLNCGMLQREKNIATLEGHTGWVSSVAFSPDGGHAGFR